MKTRVQKIEEAVDICIEKMKTAIKLKDTVTTFIAMYEVGGILIASDTFEMPEVRKMVDIDPITETFIKLCKEEAERN